MGNKKIEKHHLVDSALLCSATRKICQKYGAARLITLVESREVSTLYARWLKTRYFQILKHN